MKSLIPFGMLLSIAMLALSVLKSIFIGYPLLLSLLVFSIIARIQGNHFRIQIPMMMAGIKKTLVVLRIFILIGAITALWMNAGTVASLIDIGLKTIQVQYFSLFAFVLTSITSFMLGTSFGTVSTLGIALMLMARGAGLNVDLIGGAIIAGAYFGDRGSPMSSSANLVASLTQTDLHRNVKNMVLTGLIPYLLSLVFYVVLSFTAFKTQNTGPLDMTLSQALNSYYNIDLLALSPAILILILSLLKIDVKGSMIASIALAFAISIFHQNSAWVEVIKSALLGYTIPTEVPGGLSHLMKGGGVISMWKPALVVATANALAGLFQGTGMLKSIDAQLKHAKTRFQLYIYTCITSFTSAAIGCNQSIAIVLTDQIMAPHYDSLKIDRHDLALDIENTAVVIAAMLPWNIAALVPTTTLAISSYQYLIYAPYLFLIPVIYAWQIILKKT